MRSSPEFDVVIVGGGIVGSALLYVLSNYTNIKKIALVEKESTIAKMNSNSLSNSQTLHFGEVKQIIQKKKRRR